MAKIKRRFNQAADKPQAAWKTILLNTLRALGISLICLMILSVLLTYSSLPEKIIPLATILISLICVLFASRRATRRIGSRGWLNGGLTGLNYILLLTVLYTIFVSFPPLAVLTGYWPILLAGIVGGIWGV